MFGEKAFAYPKSEYLLQRIIEIATTENDIVLDFFAGSGTTLAAAHKMKRRYIGIEQMDYIGNITLERLKKVIDGEQGGVSKAVNWQGGGSFIYFELAKFNALAMEQIAAAPDFAALKSLWGEMRDKYFLNYNSNLKAFEEILEDEDFSNLNLGRQKEIFAKMLDLNELYVNFSEMEDAKYGLSEADKAFAREFYGEDK